MKTPHTAGPWRADAYGVVTGGVNGLTSICETHANKWAMCQANAKSEHNEAADFCGAMHKEAIANATLIAAAPELLALAEAYVVAFSLCETASAPNAHKELLAQVRAAIRKAKGQE